MMLILLIFYLFSNFKIIIEDTWSTTEVINNLKHKQNIQ